METDQQSAEKRALELASRAEEINLKPIKQFLKIKSIDHFDIWS